MADKSSNQNHDEVDVSFSFSKAGISWRGVGPSRSIIVVILAFAFLIVVATVSHIFITREEISVENPKNGNLVEGMLQGQYTLGERETHTLKIRSSTAISCTFNTDKNRANGPWPVNLYSLGTDRNGLCKDAKENKWTGPQQVNDIPETKVTACIFKVAHEHLLDERNIGPVTVHWNCTPSTQ